MEGPTYDDHQFIGPFTDDERRRITNVLHELGGDRGPISPPYWTIFHRDDAISKRFLGIDLRNQRSYKGETLEAFIEALREDLE